MGEEKAIDAVGDADEAPDQDVIKTAGTVAASGVLAVSLVGALSQPPQVDLVNLSEPVPIIQEYRAIEDDDDFEEDRRDDGRATRLQRLLKMLKYLLVALALIATVAFGALRGCAGIAGGLLLPPGDEQVEESGSHSSSQADERGVATEPGL